MNTPFPIHELDTLTNDQLRCSLNNGQLCHSYSRAMQHCFQSAGLSNLHAYSSTTIADQHISLFTARSTELSAAICLPSAANTPMELLALSTEECDVCDELLPGHDIYYASFLVDPAQKKLLLVGPVLVRRANEWLGHSEESAQFLPPRRREKNTQLSPLLNGAALFKMQNLLIPHTLTQGTLPRFSVQGLFEDRAQGNSCFYALLSSTPPTHMMIVRRDDHSQHLEFIRPFFFYADAPDSELVLVQETLLADAPESGLIQLISAAGTSLCAECVESILFPKALPTDNCYRWTLSMVAESCCLLPRHDPHPTQPLLQQARRDFHREHGCEPPNDFLLALPQSSKSPTIAQETLTARTTLTARVLSCSPTCVDSVPAQHWRVQLLPESEEIILNVFVGKEFECSPSAGDVVCLCGHLHASPDALVTDNFNPKTTLQPQFQPAKTPLTEKEACRILCNAVCSHEWDVFIASSRENLSYISHMNGTRLSTRHEFIRYMSERRQIWRSQHSFQGMCWDTGSIIYRGEEKPCYMLSCFGHMVGASILTLQEGRIATIETLPQEANSSFTPDAECCSVPRIFHPFRGHLTPHPAEQTLLQLFTASYLRECMVQKTGYCPPNTQDSADKDNCARWIKITRDEPSCCDMAFTYRGCVYAVCAVEVKNHPAHGGSIEEAIATMPDRVRLMALSEQHRLIPCIFPVERQFSPDPAQSWNLWDVRTMKPLQPETESATDATPPPSVWEILVGALAELQTRILRDGGSVIAYHDMPQLLPHFWFRDAQGTLSWVILRCTANPAQQDRSLSENELLPQQLAPGTNGYLATATAYGNAECSKPARRGKPIYLRLSELMPLSC